MNTFRYIHDLVMPAALGMLPAKMGTTPARAELMAIGLQESRFVYRTQQPEGPARSFWEFERIGVKGVLSHPATRDLATQVLRTLSYEATIDTAYEAIEHNDILACVFARLLLWSSPRALPEREDVQGGWTLYVACWRPGKERKDTWEEFYTSGWKIAEAPTSRSKRKHPTKGEAT